MRAEDRVDEGAVWIGFLLVVLLGVGLARFNPLVLYSRRALLLLSVLATFAVGVALALIIEVIPRSPLGVHITYGG